MSELILSQLQSSIENLQDVKTDVDVTHYMIDESTRRSIPGAREGLPEQLFVLEEGDSMELALYVAPDVVAGLRLDPPTRSLHQGNLENFCIALEGISHFVLVVWRAQHGLPISPLEMEIQAEVDKFLLSWLWLSEQGFPLAHTAEPLLTQLFAGWELRADVPAAEVERYTVASRAAEKFCRKVARDYGREEKTRDIKRVAREYFRQGLAQKLRAA